MSLRRLCLLVLICVAPIVSSPTVHGNREYAKKDAYYLCHIAYYCLLPIAYCLLPIACCLLPIAYCLLPIAYCLLPIAYAKPMPGWMHSAWPECILPRLDVFGRRMHPGKTECIQARPNASSQA